MILILDIYLAEMFLFKIKKTFAFVLFHSMSRKVYCLYTTAFLNFNLKVGHSFSLFNFIL